MQREIHTSMAPIPAHTLDKIFAQCQALLGGGNTAQARSCIEAVLRTHSSEARWHWLLARVFLSENDPQQALNSYQQAIELDSNEKRYLQDFSVCLTHIDGGSVSARLVDNIIKSITADVIDNSGAVAASESIIREQLRAFTRVGLQLSPSTLAKAGGAMAPSFRKLLLAFLVTGRTTDIELEDAFTFLRSAFLGEVREAAERNSAWLLDLAAALAIHCFNQEYVFTESAQESAAISVLQEGLHFTAKAGLPLNFLKVALLACYRPLYKESFSADLLTTQSNGYFRRLLTVQISHPQLESALQTTIKRVTPIVDRVSLAVKEQYEESPYPRWHRLAFDRHVNLPPHGGPVHTASRLLVAGCGTGRHPLKIAMMSTHQEIWAMDLSLASLAYAMRKADEYGIKNVKFVQGDILELEAVNVSFDVISCIGVLHHLDSPMSGLTALSKKLVPNGQLNLAVYTESGRAAVIAGIALRKSLHLSSDAADIRRFRCIVRSLPNGTLARELIKVGDFYSISECRDLVFHVQEHRFTLPSLSVLIKDAGFKVKKLCAGRTACALFRREFPNRNPDTDLNAWAEVEERHTALFGSMYNLILEKSN